MRGLFGTVVVIALWQLFEGYGTSGDASPIPSVHQSEICASRSLVNIAVSNLAVDIDCHRASCDRRYFLGCERVGHAYRRKINGATGAKDRASVTGPSAIEFGLWKFGDKNPSHSLYIEGGSEAVVFKRNPSLNGDAPIRKIPYLGGLNQYVCPLSVDFALGGAGRQLDCFGSGDNDLGLQRSRNDKNNGPGHKAAPQAHQFATAAPIDGRADTNEKRADDKQPNDGGFHAYSLHDVKMTAIVFSFAGFGLGALFGLVVALSRRKSKGV